MFRKTLASVWVVFSLGIAADAPPAAPVARVDYPADSPANWLSHQGKSDAWYTDTQGCRERLAKLDLNDARVKRFLPMIRERAEMLRRVNAFDWRTRTAVEFIQNLLDDLAAGKEPLVRYAGTGFGYPYWSNTMRRIEAIWVHVPPGYDPARRYQLFLYYKCGGGIHNQNGRAAGGYRPEAAIANQTDTFHAWSSLDIQVKGRYGIQIELEEFSAAISRDFSVDPDRVFLTGWSDGGFTTLMLGAHFPHLVAGLAPVCANWQYTNVENVALTNLPVLTIDGWGDGGYNSGQFIRWQVLRGWGADVSCMWGHHGHTYQPYEDIEEFRQILDWAKTKHRDLWPRHVRYATWNLFWNRAYWVHIDRLADPLLAGQIDVQVRDGNRIDVASWNLAAYHLTLSEKLVDPKSNVTVVTDGKESYAGPFKERIDIELVKRPEGRFIISAEMPNEISAVLDSCTYRRSSSNRSDQIIPGRTWLAVKGTACDEATGKLLEKWFPKEAKADSDVTDADLVAHNLALYGGPEINKLTARIAAELPVKFGKGQFTLGSTLYDQPTHCIAFIHPNPLNPKKYVIVYAFNDAAAFARNDYLGLTREREFRTGDAVVRGIPHVRPQFGVSLGAPNFEARHVLFGPDWKPDTRPPLGEAEKSFDYLQILRLRADALREAAGVDIGIVWEHTPPWNRWNNGLAAGPVTMQDLATQDMLPEYVCVGEMKGSELLRPRGEPAAWSLLADKSEPGYEEGKTLAIADIQPDKTYRIAYGCFGAPSYGVDTGKMPKLFRWATPEEFLAGPGTRMGIRNAVQTPLQTAEAVAQYVRKHQKIAPRPVCFSLTDYIANPRDNEYGGSDWLHLGLDIPSKRAGKGSGERYVVSLGVRPAGKPETGPPRKNSKQFAELTVGGAPTDFDFAGLDKKLPLTLAAAVKRFAVTLDAEGRTYGLAPGNADSAVGQGVLAELHLTNKGQADVALTAVLTNTVMGSIYGQVWPEDAKGQTWYSGYHRATGQPKQPPRREDAALLLGEGRLRTLIAPNAGYNFGLVGMAQELTVKAGQSVTLPLLVIFVERPENGPPVSLQAALEALRPQLLKTGTGPPTPAPGH